MPHRVHPHLLRLLGPVESRAQLIFQLTGNPHLVSAPQLPPYRGQSKPEWEKVECLWNMNRMEAWEE